MRAPGTEKESQKEQAMHPSKLGLSYRRDNEDKWCRVVLGRIGQPSWVEASIGLPRHAVPRRRYGNRKREETRSSCGGQGLAQPKRELCPSTCNSRIQVHPVACFADFFIYIYFLNICNITRSFQQITRIGYHHPSIGREQGITPCGTHWLEN